MTPSQANRRRCTHLARSNLHEAREQGMAAKLVLKLRQQRVQDNQGGPHRVRIAGLC